MKFLAPLTHFSPKSESPEKTGLLLWPDSCILPSGRPLFLPDFAEEFKIVPAFAVRITRLGKCVAPRFAHRYFTHYAPASLLMSSNALKKLENLILPSPDDYCFDSSVVVGNWLPADNLEVFSAFTSFISPDLSSKDNFSLSINVIYEAIALASLRSTLKIGDVILIPFPESGITAQENSSLSILPSEDSSPTLYTKYK